MFMALIEAEPAERCKSVIWNGVRVLKITINFVDKSFSHEIDMKYEQLVAEMLSEFYFRIVNVYNS